MMPLNDLKNVQFYDGYWENGYLLIAKALKKE
jgi:hypothetical protein